MFSPSGNVEPALRELLTLRIRYYSEETKPHHAERDDYYFGFGNGFQESGQNLPSCERSTDH
jgi:hypothetical protein